MHGPNLIHWDHNFHPANLKESLELSIENLIESKYVLNRPKISLSGNPDLEIGNLRILAAGEEVKQMIAGEDAFKLHSLLNTTYMPVDCLIKTGYEDEKGKTRPIHNYTLDSYDIRPDLYLFHPRTSGGVTGRNGELGISICLIGISTKINHVKRGEKTQEMFGRFVLKMKGMKRFNYSILVRDIGVGLHITRNGNG